MNTANKTATPTHLSILDQFIMGFDNVLKSVTNTLPGTSRANPAADLPPTTLSAAEQKHSGGLMRVNHTGEVAAQALYLGQALVARHSDTRLSLLQSAREEQDHLLWCQQRLTELNTHTSFLNPLWFWGSLSIGVTAGLFQDKYSLGFVMETERQVETHLTDHIAQLPPNDTISLAIVQKMRDDEVHHGNRAQAQGGVELPDLVKELMRIPAKIMTSIAYYL